MLAAAQLIGIAIITIVVGYLLNQLPPTRDFPGKTGLMIRLTCWMTLISITIQILGSETSDTVEVSAQFALMAAIIALFYDSASFWKLAFSNSVSNRNLAKRSQFGSRLIKILVKNLSRTEGFLRSRLFRASVVVFSMCLVTLWLNPPLPKQIRELVDILFSNSESIAITSAALLFFLEISERRKQDRYNAWHVINSATGQRASGGRIEALEDLNKDGVDLEGIVLSDADLSGVKLAFGKLRRANLESSQVDLADFTGADLVQANLSEANLAGASLVKASLTRAILVKANLKDAVLTGADLEDAVLTEAILVGANLEGAILIRSKLKGANLLGVKNLEWIQLENAEYDETTIFPDNLLKLRASRLNGEPPNE